MDLQTLKEFLSQNSSNSLPLENLFRVVQANFDSRVASYIRARENRESVATEVTDCENRLIRIIGELGDYKDFYPQYFHQIKAYRSMIELLKDEKCGIRLVNSILLAFNKLIHHDIRVRGQKEMLIQFVNSIVEVGAFEVFVSLAFGRFSEDEGIVYRALLCNARMMFLVPSLSEKAGEVKLLDWVFNALKSPKWNFLKRYAVGFLETILFSSRKNRIPEMVRVVLNAILSLEGRDEDEDPLDKDKECYLMMNLFQCLHVLLLVKNSKNEEIFADAGGFQLMMRLVQNERLSSFCCGTAIEALDIAAKDCQSVCEKFVDDALKLDPAIFSMDEIPKCHTHEKKDIEEHLVSLIASLLTGGIANEKMNILLQKFEMNEKITWLIKVFIRCSNNVDARTNCMEQKQLDPSELYNKKLQYGLSTCESIAVILDYLWSSENDVINDRIATELSRHKLQKQHVRNILRTYREQTGNRVESSAADMVVDDDEEMDSVEGQAYRDHTSNAAESNTENKVMKDYIESHKRENLETSLMWTEQDQDVPDQWMEQDGESKRRRIERKISDTNLEVPSVPVP